MHDSSRVPPSAAAISGSSRLGGGSPPERDPRRRSSSKDKTPGNATAMVLQDRLRERLSALEGALREARRENESLRAAQGTAGPGSARGASPPVPPSLDRDTAVLVREREAELAGLRARLARAEEGSDARRAVYERATSAFQEQAEELRDAR